MLEAAAPCDSCPVRRRCEAEIACSAFSSYVWGSNPARWRKLPRVPSKERFRSLFRGRRDVLGIEERRRQIVAHPGMTARQLATLLGVRPPTIEKDRKFIREARQDQRPRVFYRENAPTP